MRKLIRPVVDFILFSNLFMALCAVAQALVTFQLIGSKPVYPVLWLLFGSTFCVYNFSIYIDKPPVIQSTSIRRINWFLKNRQLMMVGIMISAAIVLVTIFTVSANTRILLGVLAVFAFGYSLPMFSKGKDKFGLRNITGLKAVLIALVWTLSCVLIPILEAGGMQMVHVSEVNLGVLIAKRFLFFAALTIPFDIRDFSHDRTLGLKTIPVMFGTKNAYLLCGLLLAAYFTMILLFRGNDFGNTFWPLICTVTAAAWLIFKPGFRKNEYYYFCIDGLLILQYATLLAFKLF